MAKSAKKLLFDVINASGLISRFTTGKTYPDYVSDDLLRSGVERQFGIIGEALASLMRDFPEVAAAIPDCRRVIAFRNVIIHNYDGIDPKTTWDVVERRLPELERVARHLLDECGN